MSSDIFIAQIVDAVWSERIQSNASGDVPDLGPTVTCTQATEPAIKLASHFLLLWKIEIEGRYISGFR